MANDLLFGGINNPAIPSTVRAAQSTQILGALKALGENPSAYGVTEGEILLALADKRDLMDPWGAQLTLTGYMTKYLGALITFLISTLGVFLLLAKSLEIGSDIFAWIKDKSKRFFGWLHTSESKETEKDDETGGSMLTTGYKFEASRVGVNALYGLLLGFLSPPMAAVVNAILWELLLLFDINIDLFGRGAGPNPSSNTQGKAHSPSTTTMPETGGPTTFGELELPSLPPEPETGSSEVANLITGAMEGLWNLIFGESTQDGDPATTGEWIDAISKMKGMSRAEASNVFGDDLSYLKKVADVLEYKNWSSMSPSDRSLASDPEYRANLKATAEQVLKRIQNNVAAER